MNLKIKRILGESVAAGGKTTVMRESGKGWSTGEATTATTREAERANERDATRRDGERARGSLTGEIAQEREREGMKRRAGEGSGWRRPRTGAPSSMCG